MCDWKCLYMVYRKLQNFGTFSWLYHCKKIWFEVYKYSGGLFIKQTGGRSAYFVIFVEDILAVGRISEAAIAKQDLSKWCRFFGSRRMPIRYLYQLWEVRRWTSQEEESLCETSRGSREYDGLQTNVDSVTIGALTLSSGAICSCESP